MANTVFISYDEGEPPHTLPIDEDKLYSFIFSVLEKRGHACWEVSLLFTNNSKIQELNKTYRNVDEATDVLSFPMGERYVDEVGDEHLIAGDIVLCFEVIKENATRFSVSVNQELKRMIIHSILHLEGLDHASSKIDEPMLLLQEEILKSFESFNVIKDEKN